MRAPETGTARDRDPESGAPNSALPDTPVSMGDEAAHARRLSRIGFALVAVLLLFLVFPGIGLYEMRSEPVRFVMAALGTALFAAIYTWAAWRAVRMVFGTGAPLRSSTLLATFAGLSALALFLPVVYGDNWVGVFVPVGILAGLTLRFRAVALVCVAITLLTVATAGVTQIGWGPAISITINAALSGLVAYGIRWLVETNRELRAARREISRLAVSEERLRLSREIHDTLAQGLASIVMHLAPARQSLRTEPGTTEQHLRQIDRTARESLEEARRLVRALRPEALEDASLAEALGRAAGNFAEETGVHVETRVNGDPNPLPPEVEVALLRVAQEALTNVRKHAGASVSRVAMTLSYLGDAVALDVRDDGVGFDVDRQASGHPYSGGFGLKGMRERIEALGGTFSVESSSGGGTALAVELPVTVEPQQPVGEEPSGELP